MTDGELRHGAATDVGCVREVNEDALLVAPPVFAVADGMGGHQGGDVASGIAVEELGRLEGGDFTPRTAAAAVAQALSSAQRRIHEYAREQHARRTDWYAGTTAVVAVLVHDDDGAALWLLANLGDSRVYRVAEGRTEQVSVDHSLVQELLDAGQITADEMATHPERNVVTRALGGPESDPEADYFLLPVGSAGRLLLCSDGVNGMLDEARINAVLTGVADPAEAARRVVAAAVAAGGVDNATAVVVDVVGRDADEAYDSAQQRASLEEKLGGRS